jgi:hypothetical protein
MKETAQKKYSVQLSFSEIISEKLEEAVQIYAVPLAGIIQEIIEENLPKWIQRHHVKKNFSLAAEKLRLSQAASPEEILIKQDELDKVFRFMSTPSKSS